MKNQEIKNQMITVTIQDDCGILRSVKMTNLQFMQYDTLLGEAKFHNANGNLFEQAVAHKAAMDVFYNIYTSK